MLARKAAPCQSHDWKSELARAYRRPEDLLAALSLSASDIPDLDTERQAFGLLVPRGFASSMREADPTDPLLLQVLPLRVERRKEPGYSDDPVGDLAAQRTRGVLQKYPRRVLLMPTGACAIHCRYCFRRHFPHQALGTHHLWVQRAVAEIAAEPQIEEVILSGGDPLMLDDAALGALVSGLDRVPHLRRLRIHTRLPIVLPSRVTSALCTMLAQTRLTTVVVLHSNHPREIGDSARQAIQSLAGHGAQLLNQSVLLRGVNDEAEVLAALSQRLIQCNVLPYYLHQLDPVQGAARFQVDDESARMLVQTLRGQLPGYLVPRLVKEIAGRRSKTPMD